MKNSLTLFPLILGIIILGALGFNQEAFAATIESNGTGGGNWNNGSSWLGGVIPTTTDDVVIKSGDIVTIISGASIDGKITVESGGELIIQESVFEINGMLTTNGIIKINGGNSLGSGRLNNLGTIQNHGIIDVKAGSATLSGLINNFGTLNNFGTINFIGDFGGSGGGALRNFGTFVNFDTLNFLGGRFFRSGSFHNFSGGIIINDCGIINIDRDSENINTFGATILNFGVFNNNGELRNDGIFSNIPKDCVEEINIDIKPGSDPNSIQPMKMGVTAVVILSSSTFSAETVDFSTVTFGPDEATPVHKKPHIEDVNNDWLDDMVLHFKTKEIGIEQNTLELCLMAKTLGGTSIEGCDSIKVVPKS